MWLWPEGEQEGFAVDKQLQNNSLLVAVSSRKKKSLDALNQEHWHSIPPTATPEQIELFQCSPIGKRQSSRGRRNFVFLSKFFLVEVKPINHSPARCFILPTLSQNNLNQYFKSIFGLCCAVILQRPFSPAPGYAELLSASPYFHPAAGRQSSAASQALGLRNEVTKAKTESGNCCSPNPLHKSGVPRAYTQNYLYILTFYLEDQSN